MLHGLLPTLTVIQYSLGQKFHTASQRGHLAVDKHIEMRSAEMPPDL